jgi:hypothetical protein
METKNTKKPVTEEELTTIKNKLENEGMEKAKNILSSGNMTEKKIKDVLAEGAKQFEEQTGRKMTYGEMREMYG